MCKPNLHPASAYCILDNSAFIKRGRRREGVSSQDRRLGHCFRSFISHCFCSLPSSASYIEHCKEIRLPQE